MFDRDCTREEELAYDAYYDKLGEQIDQKFYKDCVLGVLGILSLIPIGIVLGTLIKGNDLPTKGELLEKSCVESVIKVNPNIVYTELLKVCDVK